MTLSQALERVWPGCVWAKRDTRREAILEEVECWSWKDKPKLGAAGGPTPAGGSGGHRATGQMGAQKGVPGRTVDSGFPDSRSKDAAARQGTDWGDKYRPGDKFKGEDEVLDFDSSLGIQRLLVQEVHAERPGVEEKAQSRAS